MNASSRHAKAELEERKISQSLMPTQVISFNPGPPIYNSPQGFKAPQV